MTGIGRTLRALTCAVGFAVVGGATAAGCSGGGEQGSAAAGRDIETPSAACGALTGLELRDTTISLAEVVPAGSFTPPAASNVIDLPSFCRVVGMTTPAVNFEVWLPVDDWNGKFQGVGNGGMAGSIRYAGMGTALNRGYATASTDTGHTAGDVSFDASWALGRPDLIEDFGHRSLHVTTVNAKAVTAAFYSAPPSYSYYIGCSKGGQQGLMEAQRYPDDYDGVIAGDPANDWTRFYAGAHLWYSLALLDDPESYIALDKLQVLGDAVNTACDTQDGIGDGVLQDPRSCDFDPSVLICGSGSDDASCLTAKQVAAVEKIWSGVTDSSGELIFPGLVPGGEGAPGGWSRWVTGRRAVRVPALARRRGVLPVLRFRGPGLGFSLF